MNLSFLFVFSYIAKVSSDRCCDVNCREAPRYDVVRPNARSTSSAISRTNVSNVKECQEFAVSKKALAFNFQHGPEHEDYSKRNDPYNVNCFVLGCPDIHNFTSLVNDSSFSYYSLYSGRVHRLTGSLTCVPSIGLFAYFEEAQNYTNARDRCANFHGKLAHIASEKRTKNLAMFTSDSPIYVGLSNQDDEKIWKNEYSKWLTPRLHTVTNLHLRPFQTYSSKNTCALAGLIKKQDQSLSCFDYRAWGEGEPAHSRGCGTLVQMKSELPYWKVVPCDLSLPYVCEVLPKRKRINHRHRKTIEA